MLVIAALAGVLTSLGTAVGLMPRVRVVDVVLVFFGAFGAGAALTGALVELKTKRAARSSVRGGPLARFLIAVFSANVVAQTAPTPPAELDAYVARTMQTFSVPGTKPSLPLSKYAGTYVDEWYGEIAIEEQQGRLGIRFTRTPSLTGTLEYWQHDTFIARWSDRELRADAYITFALNPDGTIDQAKMRAVSPATDFSFDFHDLLLKPKPAARPRVRRKEEGGRMKKDLFLPSSFFLLPSSFLIASEPAGRGRHHPDWLASGSSRRSRPGCCRFAARCRLLPSDR
jgi:hypothetical protein